MERGWTEIISELIEILGKVKRIRIKVILKIINSKFYFRNFPLFFILISLKCQRHLIVYLLDNT